jgi:lysyl-tRNA synthetase class 2
MPTTTRRTTTPATARLHRARVAHRAYLHHAPTLIAGLARLAGLLTMLDTVLPARERARAHQLVPLLPIPATDAATAATVALGLLLLRVAAGLRRRKRRAWRIAVAATILIGLAHLLKAHRDEDGGAAVLATTLALLAMLITAHARFTARSDPASRWFALRIAFQFTAAGLTLGVLTLYLNPENVEGHATFWTRLTQALAALVGATGPLRLHGERFRDGFTGSLLAIGLLTAAILVVLILRPSEPLARLSRPDEDQLRAVLHRHGHRDSLGYFALRRDKSVIWSASGKAAVTYRVLHGVILASGDPLGDPEAWPGAIAAYQELAEQYGWARAVIGCSELAATIYQRECGLRAIQLGDEAIITTSGFTLEGRPMRGVRQACTRITRAGYDVQTRYTSMINPSELDDLARAADAWRGDTVERGFSMALSRLGDPADGDCVIVTAKHNGALRGLLHLVPWGNDGLSLDLMRRDHASDNGLNEYLIVKLIEAAPALGIARISLNFAVFRDAIDRGARIGAGPFLRAWRRLLIIASRWWQIDTLYRFNVKFRPSWQPRFLSYEAGRDLPRILLAALEAEAFLTRPPILKRLLRRPTGPTTGLSNDRTHVTSAGSGREYPNAQ